MSDPLMIYGATGFTGRLLTQAAIDLGLRPVLGGRNEEQLAALAGSLGLEHRVARLDDPARLDAALKEMRVVLHAAGPFSGTSAPMVDACFRTGTHYLDITGEIPVIEALAQRDAEARRRAVMIMPGVGFDVVPSDCLAAHVAARLPGAERLALGITGLAFATRGSAKTLAEHAGYGVKVRRNGAITSVPAGSLERGFNYGAGVKQSVNMSWGDVASAYYTTGIPNIEVYFETTPTLRVMLTATRLFGWALRTAPWQVWMKAHAEMLPEGPTERERTAIEMVIVAEVETAGGQTATSRLRTPEAYTFTGVTGAAIAQRALWGDLELGFQTPGRVYGADFVLGLPEVSREDLA